LNQGEDRDDAVEVFRNVVRDRANTEVLSPEALKQLYDALLIAIANCDSPQRFSPELERIKSRIGNSVPESGWRNHQLGWGYLRIGKANEASQLFTRARQLYDPRQEWSDGVDPVRGLTFVALAEGDVKSASGNIQQRRT
jgi:hypothetical protein